AHAGLEVLEVGRVLEREFELRLIQHVEDDDVVPAVAQAPHGATYHVRLLVEVRNEDEDAAAAVVLGELREWSAELARLAGAGAVERVQDEIEVSGGGRHVLDDVAVERGEPDPGALLVREVREAGRGEAGVVELGDAL